MEAGSGCADELTDRLRRHVDRLAGLIGSRHAGRPSSLEAAASLIERELSQMGCVVERQPYRIHDVMVANLVAETPGDVPEEGTLVVGAHYDTVDTTPGADDNASAIAVLLETARTLYRRRFRKTVRFVAFTCEEPPHFCTGEMGSQIYARACRERGERIVGMICLEMLGYFTNEPNSQRVPPGIPRPFSWLFPRRGTFLAAVGNLRSWRLAWSLRQGFKRSSDVPLWTIVLPESVNAIRLSDNSSFWDQGYPALMLTDTSFLRNPHYHLPSDLPETLAFSRMAEATLGLAGAVARLAGDLGTNPDA
jgi:hypothetical protein